MVVHEKIYFEACINNQYICHKHYIVQLYFILRRAELHWNFPVYLRMALILTDFPTGSRS